MGLSKGKRCCLGQDWQLQENQKGFEWRQAAGEFRLARSSQTTRRLPFHSQLPGGFPFSCVPGPPISRFRTRSLFLLIRGELLGEARAEVACRTEMAYPGAEQPASVGSRGDGGGQTSHKCCRAVFGF